MTATDTAPPTLARPSLANAAVRDQARIWLAADNPPLVTDADESMLHACETAALTRPPAADRARTLDADLVELYLRLCRRWAAVTNATRDPRFLNTALKILDVCAHSPSLPSQLATAVMQEALTAVGTVSLRVPSLTPHEPASTTPPPPVTDWPPRSGLTRIAVLAGAGSRGLHLFMTAARAARVPITGILVHEPDPGQPPPHGYYAHAWYPQPTVPAATPAPPTPEDLTVSVAHRDWDAAAAQLAAWNVDLLVLLGMDIVPPTVRDVPHVATINAHNGALPGYRGMDAVAWAILAGDQPRCTVHLATPEVDAGDVLCEQAVPTDTGDLRHAVKDTQINLLLTVCSTLTTTGSLPSSRAQTGMPCRYYRMHPTIRQIADARFTQLHRHQEGSRT